MENKNMTLKECRLKSLKIAVVCGGINIIFYFIGYVFKIDDISIKANLLDLVINICVSYFFMLFILKGIYGLISIDEK